MPITLIVCLGDSGWSAELSRWSKDTLPLASRCMSPMSQTSISLSGLFLKREPMATTTASKRSERMTMAVRSFFAVASYEGCLIALKSIGV